MKKIILIIAITLSFNFYSQESIEKTSFKHELKLDAFDLAIFTVIDVGYEKLFKEEMSYGLSIFIN